MKRIIRDYLFDILIECNFLLEEYEKLKFEEFVSDERLKRAFIRSLEIIGEASKKISLSVKERYPDVKWKEVAGMRDKLIHEYFGVDYIVIWQTVKRDIPNLKKIVEDILNDYDKEINR